MTFHRKGASNFIYFRLMRIAVPFVVGWFILRPLIVSGWVMDAESLRGAYPERPEDRLSDVGTTSQGLAHR